MLSSVENDLAKANRRWTDKKMPNFAKAPCCLDLFGLLSQAFATWRGGGMLFSVFALAVDRFVTIGCRTAQLFWSFDALFV